MSEPKRILVLTLGADDQNRHYVDAATKLGLEVVFGAEQVEELSSSQRQDALTLQFDRRDSALHVVQYALERPLAAIVTVGDAAAPVAARAASMMGMASHPPHAADIIANPERARQRLANSGLKLHEGAPGEQVTAEAMLDHGKLRVVALLDHISSEASEISITPTGHDSQTQQRIVGVLRDAVKALGLFHGPVGARFALKGDEVSIVRVRACPMPAPGSRALRFRIPLVDDDISLEELAIRLALELDVARVYREKKASGFLHSRSSFEKSRERLLRVPGIEDVRAINAQVDWLLSLGARNSRRGFVLARGETAVSVRDTLASAAEELSV